MRHLVLVGWLALGGLAWAAPGGVPVVLPADEDPAQWQLPFAESGLELALPAGRARVRIESGSTLWRVVALDGAEVTRELFVPAPVDETDRREIAVLARAISVELAPLDPPGTLPPSAPPPPVWIRPEAPPPAPEPEPEPEPVAPAPPETVAPPTPVAVAAPPDARAPLPVWPFTRREPGERRERRRRRPRVTEAPPTALLFGVAARQETQTAAMLGVQTDALTAGPLLVTTELAIQPARRLGPISNRDDEIWRQVIDTRGLVGVGAVLAPALRVGVVGGVTSRNYRQEWRPVRTSMVPLAGAQAELVVGGVFRVGLRLQALADLVTTELVDSTGRSRVFDPVDANASLVLRLQPRQRPRPPKHEPSSPARSLDPADLETLPEL